MSLKPRFRFRVDIRDLPNLNALDLSGCMEVYDEAIPVCLLFAAPCLFVR